MQAVLFDVKDRELLGHRMASGGHQYCCTKGVVPDTKCHVDRLIYKVGIRWPCTGCCTQVTQHLELVHAA